MDERKNIRLKNHDYSGSGLYFITVCTLGKEELFWVDSNMKTECPQNVKLSLSGQIVDDAIKSIPRIYPTVDVKKYVIMPDHVHMIIRLSKTEGYEAPDISRIMAQMKGHVTKCLGRQIWQKLFYDHIIRNKDDYLECAKYIYYNPIRWFEKRNIKDN